MSIEVKVPVLPESVADATVAAWHKKVGDKVTRDENLLDLETDKVVLEVPAPADGVLSEILFQTGDTVTSGQLLAKITAGATTPAAAETTKPEEKAAASSAEVSAHEDKSTSPVVRRMMAEHDLQPGQIPGSGKDGRITKDDVLSYIESNRGKAAPAASKSAPAPVAAMGAREERRVPMTRLRAKLLSAY